MTRPAAELVGGLSLKQKAGLLNGVDAWSTMAIPTAGLPSIELSDGPHGLRTETGVDMVWIPSTCFPTGSALGATWDRDLVARVAAAIGAEARAMGVQVVLGPGVNMKRTPLCGRNFEYFAEDPLLAGDLAAAYIGGVQSQGVAACLKHFAANNQETERTQISVEADERTLREIYLEAFRRAIAAADPWSVMCSYNRIAGIHASQHHWLLTEILRDEWGYAGAVVSDWDAVHDPVAAVAAGLDLEMPSTHGRSAAAIVAAVQNGQLSAEAVDQAATRVAQLVQRCLPDGDVASPVRDLGITPGTPLSGEQRQLLDADAHHRLAREAAQAAITLLRNEDQTLPLDPGGTQRIAVIGGYARTPRIQGGGSAGVAPTQVDQPLAAIRAIAGDRVSFAEGYRIAETNYYRESSIHQYHDAATLRQEAIDTANAADLVVAFVGLPLVDEEEALDRTTLALPAAQAELLEELQRLGKPLVVVLAVGSAVTLDPWHDGSQAILLTWLGGQGVGAATADVLFGLAEPGGRLAESFPMALSDTPGYSSFPGANGRVEYAEGLLIGYRWYDTRQVPVRYPFGHGLSYTTFAYSDASLRQDDDRVLVRATITNTGDRPGSEVVQLYVEPPAGDTARPAQELRGFEKVRLDPGEQTTIEFSLAVRDFAIADIHDKCWHQAEGMYRVVLASSSRQPRIALDVPRSKARVPFRVGAP